MVLADEPEQAEIAIQAHQDDIDDAGWKVPIDAGALRHIGDALAGLGDRFAECFDVALQWRNDSEHGL